MRLVLHGAWMNNTSSNGLRKFEQLKSFEETQGSLMLPGDEKDSLWQWAKEQRVQVANGMVEVERKVLLDALCVQWDVGSPILKG
jgi:hypothetical protein